MVNIRGPLHCVVAALSLLCGITFAAPRDQPRAVPARVKAIVITESGRSEHSDDYAVALCKRFEPSAAQVRMFIEQAREVDSRVHTHERYSPCFASGTVEFENGMSGAWRIHSGRTGTLRVGPSEGMTLQCRSCRWSDPFEGGYASR